MQRRSDCFADWRGCIAGKQRDPLQWNPVQQVAMMQGALEVQRPRQHQ